MKPKAESNVATENLKQNQHSVRFEELAVVLPEHIEQPSLKQLAQRVQQAMFEEETHPQDSVHKDETNNLSIYEKDEFDSNNQPVSQSMSGDIGKARNILRKLVDTPNADAAVLVLITHEAHPKLMLTRRAAHLNSHAGEVSFAGGKHDRGDGNNVVTALREACEETALPPNKAQIIGQLPTQVSKKGLIVRPIVALVKPPVTYVPELGEIARIFWADFERLMTEPTTDHVIPLRMGDESMMIKTPSWQVDGEVVWGLTGRILASLLKIGFDRDVDWYYESVDSP